MSSSSAWTTWSIDIWFQAYEATREDVEEALALLRNAQHFYEDIHQPEWQERRRKLMETYASVDHSTAR